MNWPDFFYMGGYAFYVWTSYALFVIVIAINAVSPVLQRKKIITRIKRTIKREQLLKQDELAQ